jgi:acetyl esterase/lipase
MPTESVLFKKDGKAHDPQMQSILREIAAASRGESPRSVLEQTPDDVRGAPDRLAPYRLASERVANVEDRTIRGYQGKEIRVRIYTPEGTAPFPVLVYYHGGCWVFCTIDMYDHLCRALARRAGCVVVSVDYRLAPEHRFPTGVEDAYAAARWASENAARIGGDPSRIAVGGDSAGGNLAAVVSLLARDRAEFSPALQLLIYPITDISTAETESYRTYSNGFLSRDMMVWASNHYIREEGDRRNPAVSPLLAPDLRGLPPAFLVTAESDILRDEGEAYGERLAAAGVPVSGVRYRGVEHAFIVMAGKLDAGRQALEDCAEALVRSFAAQGDHLP